MVNQESGYRQFDSSGNPIWGKPDGIGLLQLEPQNRASLDEDFWRWPTNLTDGLQLLNTLQSPAYAFWNRQVTQWQADPAAPANPVPEWSRTYCDFKYPPTNADNYQDAEWIKAFNGAPVYFIFWINSTSGSNPPDGHWVINDSAGYVNAVCTKPSL